MRTYDRGPDASLLGAILKIVAPLESTLHGSFKAKSDVENNDHVEET